MIHAKAPKPETPSGYRSFDTGATRDQDTDKYDFDGFLSPLVLERYAEYMHAHRQLPDGSLRESDNWQRGIPLSAYMKSAWRHFRSWWRLHRGYPADETLEESLCALIFNASGYLHELIKQRKAQCDFRDFTELQEIAKQQTEGLRSGLGNRL